MRRYVVKVIQSSGATRKLGKEKNIDNIPGNELIDGSNTGWKDVQCISSVILGFGQTIRFTTPCSC